MERDTHERIKCLAQEHKCNDPGHRTLGLLDPETHALKPLIIRPLRFLPLKKKEHIIYQEKICKQFTRDIKY